jgi:hypothetical protein
VEGLHATIYRVQHLPLHTPRGFITSTALLYTALSLVLGVQFFVPEKIAVFYKTAMNSAREQSDLVAGTQYSHLADNPGQGDYGGSYSGGDSASSNGDDSPSEHAGGPGSGAGGSTSGGSHGTGGGSTSGGSTSGGSDAGREGQTSGPGGGANSGGGFGPGSSGSGGDYSHEGQSSGPGGGANSGGGFNPGNYTDAGANGGQVNDRGMGAFSGAVGGWATSAGDYLSGLYSQAKSLLSGLTPANKQVSLTNSQYNLINGIPTSIQKTNFPTSISGLLNRLGPSVKPTVTQTFSPTNPIQKNNFPNTNTNQITDAIKNLNASFDPSRVADVTDRDIATTFGTGYLTPSLASVLTDEQKQKYYTALENVRQQKAITDAIADSIPGIKDVQTPVTRGPQINGFKDYAKKAAELSQVVGTGYPTQTIQDFLGLTKFQQTLYNGLYTQSQQDQINTAVNIAFSEGLLAELKANENHLAIPEYTQAQIDQTIAEIKQAELEENFAATMGLANSALYDAFGIAKSYLPQNVVTKLATDYITTALGYLTQSPTMTAAQIQALSLDQIKDILSDPKKFSFAPKPEAAAIGVTATMVKAQVWDVAKITLERMVMFQQLCDCHVQLTGGETDDGHVGASHHHSDMGGDAVDFSIGDFNTPISDTQKADVAESLARLGFGGIGAAYNNRNDFHADSRTTHTDWGYDNHHTTTPGYISDALSRGYKEGLPTDTAGLRDIKNDTKLGSVPSTNRTTTPASATVTGSKNSGPATTDVTPTSRPDTNTGGNTGTPLSSAHVPADDIGKLNSMKSTLGATPSVTVNSSLGQPVYSLSYNPGDVRISDVYHAAWSAGFTNVTVSDQPGQYVVDAIGNNRTLSVVQNGRVVGTIQGPRTTPVSAEEDVKPTINTSSVKNPSITISPQTQVPKPSSNIISGTIDAIGRTILGPVGLWPSRETQNAVIQTTDLITSE